MKKVVAFIFVFLFVTSVRSFAAHPLITDDTGTQGKGRFQLELNAEYKVEKEDGSTEKVFDFTPTLSYGIAETLDLVIGLPYQQIKIDSFKENGLGDLEVQAKWRFYEKDGLSLALKPGISFPTGDEDKGLGTGKTSYSLFFIATKELKPVNVHLNLGYIRNENKFDERKNIWHASFAGEMEVSEKLKLVANVGAETNPDRSSNTAPSFALLGFIYSINDNVSIDFGYKYGLTKPETDSSYLFGIAIKF